MPKIQDTHPSNFDQLHKESIKDVGIAYADMLDFHVCLSNIVDKFNNHSVASLAPDVVRWLTNAKSVLASIKQRVEDSKKRLPQDLVRLGECTKKINIGPALFEMIQWINGLADLRAKMHTVLSDESFPKAWLVVP